MYQMTGFDQPIVLDASQIAHEGGNRLKYQLHLTLVRMPNAFLTTTAAGQV